MQTHGPDNSTSFRTHVADTGRYERRPYVQHQLRQAPRADRARRSPAPSAPSLEYERKEAKALLKQIRAGDADALRRVHSTHPVALRDRSPDELKLADVQHVIAREYGFASWPRLVEYFEELERHRNAPRYNSSDRRRAARGDRREASSAGTSAAIAIVARELCALRAALLRAIRSPRSWRRRSREDDARLVVARRAPARELGGADRTRERVARPEGANRVGSAEHSLGARADRHASRMTSTRWPRSSTSIPSC